jgi:GNAT superfamily N-acetyltransferase
MKDMRSNFHLTIEDAADPSDLAVVHVRCFPDFYTTKMGFAFVKEYYSTVLDYPEKIALVAKEKGKTLGFAVGFYNPHNFYQKLKKKKIKLLLVSLVKLLKNPNLLLRTLSNSNRINTENFLENSIELSSIAVLPESRGIGSILLQEFLKRASETPHSVVSLTTDAKNNDDVNSFYLKNGFHLTETYDDNGRIMNKYSIESRS